jgi:general secretion pathway protein J
MTRGFTLVELMVALAIFGLVASAGVALLGQGVATQDRVRERAQRIMALERTRAQLRADIAQLAPRPTRDSDGLPRPAFSGGDDGSGEPLLAFVRRGWENPDETPRASLQYVTYAVEEGRLERRTAPMLDGVPADSATVVIDGVTDVATRFRREGVWRDDWRPQRLDEMPDAVELELQIVAIGAVRLLFPAPPQLLGQRVRADAR